MKLLVSMKSDGLAEEPEVGAEEPEEPVEGDEAEESTAEEEVIFMSIYIRYVKIKILCKDMLKYYVNTIIYVYNIC